MPKCKDCLHCYDPNSQLTYCMSLKPDRPNFPIRPNQSPLENIKRVRPDLVLVYETQPDVCGFVPRVTVIPPEQI